MVGVQPRVDAGLHDEENGYKLRQQVVNRAWIQYTTGVYIDPEGVTLPGESGEYQWTDLSRFPRGI